MSLIILRFGESVCSGLWRVEQTRTVIECVILVLYIFSDHSVRRKWMLQ